MKRKKQDILNPHLLLIFIILLLPFLIFSEEQLEKDTNKIDMRIETAVTIGNFSGNDEMVGEYFTLKEFPRAILGFESSLYMKDIFFRSELFYNHEDDQVYVVDASVNDLFSISFDHRIFSHRLGHDPLNLTVLQEPASIQMADENPGGIPGFTYGITNFKIKSANPAKNLTFHAGYRVETRNGERQSISMLSSLQPWTVYGMEGPINQIVQDYQGGITFKLGPFTFDDTYSYRDYRVKDTPATISTSGLKYDDVPEFNKSQNIFSIMLNLPLRSSFYANYVTYSIKNSTLKDNFGVDGMTYDSFLARIATTPVKSFRLNAYYRYQDMDTDLKKWYNADIPSILNRKVNTWGAKAVYRVNRRLSLNYNFQSKITERENGISETIHPLKTEKITHKINFKARLFKKVKFRLEWQNDDVNNPFANLGLFSEAAEYGELYPKLSSLVTTKNIFRSQLEILFSRKFNADIDFEWGKGDYKGNTDTQWSQEYQQFGFTMNYLEGSSLSLYMNFSLLSGDAYTYLGPDLADLEYVQDGFWLTGKVPYSDNIQSYSLGFVLYPLKRLLLNGHLMYVKQDASADTSLLTAMGLESFGEYSKHDLNSLFFSLTGNYEVAKNTFLKILLIYGRYRNEIIYISDIDGIGWTCATGIVWRTN